MAFDTNSDTHPPSRHIVDNRKKRNLALQTAVFVQTSADVAALIEMGEVYNSISGQIVDGRLWFVSTNNRPAMVKIAKMECCFYG
jgi:hypothetical protein